MAPGRLAQVLGGIPKTFDPALLVGYAGSDDAAVYRIADRQALVMTVDFFPPMIDDPYLFGQVAAANALSDVYAMGGRPLVALNLVGFPTKKLPLGILGEILRGGAEKVAEAKAVIGGGHTIEDLDIKYGLSVTGIVDPSRVWKNGGVRIGDLLILTKPLGSGLAASAVKKEAMTGPVIDEAIRWMATLNARGIEHLHAARVSTATDITGFGLAGHARELLADAAATIEIRGDLLPRIPGIEQLFKPNLPTGGSRSNREFFKSSVRLADGIDPWIDELVHDPQTSGGLLVAIHPDDADRALRGLKDAGMTFASVIGEVRPAEDDVRVRIR